MTREFWTKEEEELLRVEYPQKTEKELLSLFPGRSWHSLKRKANKLNTIKRNIWSQEELDIVRQYKALSKEELLSKLPGRNWIAIKSMAHVLGEKKRFTWTEEVENKLKQVYNTLNKQELLKLFPETTWNTIQTKACELGLTGEKIKNWTEKELNILKTNYPLYPQKISKEKVLSLLPGRTWGSIMYQANKLNISCIWNWTEEEVSILKEFYPTCDREEMEKKLPNRNWESIMGKAQHLGVGQKKWTEEEDKIITQSYKNLEYSKEQIMEMLSRHTWHSIVSRANVLNIPGRRNDMSHRDDIWTDEDLDILESRYATATREDLMAMFPDRTWDAIRQAGKKLVSRFEMKLHGPIWTKAEDDLVIKYYTSAAIKEITSSLPHRSWGAIRTRASYLSATGRYNPVGHIMETHILDIIDEILNEAALRNRRYDWMLSPKGSPLEIDGYYPKHNLAVECQGIQHFVFADFIHSTKEAFEYQQTCDTIKRTAIKTKNIILLEIKYDEPLTEEHLRTRLEELGVLQCQRS